jgi:polyhydroxyalkanoate synthesis regulator phasin
MRSRKRIGVVAVLAVLALLAVGASSALAHGGPWRGGVHARMMPGGGSLSSLLSEAARQLGVSKAALTDAIEKSALERVDALVEDEELDADDAADLKEEVRDNVQVAYSLSRASTVAKHLGVTTAKLNTEFRDARKALIVKRIDEAVEDGDLDADDAAELKTRLDDATFPGYKASPFTKGLRGFGLPRLAEPALHSGFGFSFGFRF